MINFKRYFNEDIRDLLDAAPYSNLLGEKANTSVVALEEDRMIGIGRMWNNPIHPYREYIGIYVKPEYRKQGIGKELFNQLHQSSKTQKLQVAVQSKDTTAISFLSTCGFQVARKYYTPILKISKSNCSEDEFDERAVFSFENAMKVHQNNMFKLHLKNYTEFHQRINPLSKVMTIERWKEIILADFNQEQSKLLIVNEEVIAYILCYDTDDSNQIEVGYIGGKDLSLIEKYLPFFKWSICQLMALFEEVSIEADDVDPYAFSALNSYEYDTSLSLDTYLL